MIGFRCLKVGYAIVMIVIQAVINSTYTRFIVETAIVTDALMTDTTSFKSLALARSSLASPNLVTAALRFNSQAMILVPTLKVGSNHSETRDDFIK
jgi:hypothetical protein